MEEEDKGLVVEEEDEGFVMEEEDKDGIVEEEDKDVVVEEEFEDVIVEEEVEDMFVEKVVQEGNLKSSLTTYQCVLHPIALLILSTKTQMLFALYISLSTFCTNRGGLQVKWFHSRMPFPKCLREQDTISGRRKWVFVFCVWKDTHVVSVVLTCPPGHQSEKMVSRNCLGADGKQTTMD